MEDFDILADPTLTVDADDFDLLSPDPDHDPTQPHDDQGEDFDILAG